MDMPSQTRKTVFADTQKKLEDASPESAAHTDSLLVLSTYYLLGFGCEKDTTMASKLLLQAACYGSQMAQYKCLSDEIMLGTSLEISTDTRIDWLISSLVLNAARSQEPKQREIAVATERHLRNIPLSHRESCLTEAFKLMYLQDFRILHMLYNLEAEDGLWELVAKGNVDVLRKRLSENPQLLEARHYGHGLIHFAADYCQQVIIRCKILADKLATCVILSSLMQSCK